MDLLLQSGYGEDGSAASSSSEGGGHNEEGAQRWSEDPLPPVASSVATGPGRCSGSGTRKRPRCGDGAGTGGDGTKCPMRRKKAGTLASPSAPGAAPAAPPSSSFVRSVPHTPGSWASHVFCPIPLVGGGGRYDAHNLAASRRLCGAAMGLVGQFEHLVKAADADAELVSHVPSPCDDAEDSDSAGEDDDDKRRKQDHSDSDGDPIESCSEGYSRGGIPTEEVEIADRPAIPLHLSLSRPFYLQQHSIAPFIDRLGRELTFLTPVPVLLDPTRPEILVNDQKTRTFLSIPVTGGTSAGVVRMIRIVDEVLVKFGQPVYYKEPRVHVSIASIPGNVNSKSEDLERWNEVLREQCKNGNHSSGGAITFMIDRISCTFGNTNHHSFPLKG